MDVDGQVGVLAVLGTRPEAIKLAPVALASRAGRSPGAIGRGPDRDEGGLVVALATTGQHGTVVDEALAAFGLEADHRLDCPRTDGGLPELLAGMVPSVAGLVRRTRPAAVVVQGDTSSALAGALAGFYEGVPVVHVEAGLSTDDVASPFPEEAHRRLISTVASLHLAPTARAAATLVARGVEADRIVVTGNTVVDAVRHVAGRDVALRPDLGRLLGRPGPFAVLTAHRRESWGAPMARIGRAVVELADRHPDLRVVVVSHPNPVLRREVAGHVAGHDRVVCIDPLPYDQFVALVSRASVVLTDSGGLQEELPTLGVPLVVLREETERPEAVEVGAAVLAGTDVEGIVKLASEALDGTRPRPAAGDPFGDGTAGARSVEAICALVRARDRRTDRWSDLAL